MINELLKIVKKNRKLSHWTSNATMYNFKNELKDEVNEICQAIDNDDSNNLKEEIGDVLFDLLTLSLMAEEKYGFNINDSIQNVIKKFKNRKPHIFNGEKISPEDESKIWKEAKKREKNEI